MVKYLIITLLLYYVVSNYLLPIKGVTNHVNDDQNQQNKNQSEHNNLDDEYVEYEEVN